VPPAMQAALDPAALSEPWSPLRHASGGVWSRGRPAETGVAGNMRSP
jgi:hypothetical protein